MARLRLNQRAIRAVAAQPVVQARVRQVADGVADAAERKAPRATGAGAGSICAERQPDGTYRVSWDTDHFYLSFHEFGTATLPARPFLRPAADEYR